jgi:hypothetical protein
MVALEEGRLWPGVLVQAAIAIVVTLIAVRHRNAIHAGPQPK